jgi:acetylglutamate kinase
LRYPVAGWVRMMLVPADAMTSLAADIRVMERKGSQLIVVFDSYRDISKCANVLRRFNGTV